MKNLLKFAAVFLMSVNYVSAQDQIQNWQLKNPNVLFIEVSDLDEFDTKIKNDQNTIVYYGEISIEDIESYENRVGQSTKQNYSIVSDTETADYVKQWIGENQDVDIVKRSLFESLNEVQQLDFINTDALIMQGEVLTITDIQDYENY